MRLTRVFVDASLVTNHDIQLDVNASNHLLHVLRLKPGDGLAVFDGPGKECQAQLIASVKNRAIVKVGNTIDAMRESPLTIHLGQAISRGEKMDYSLQKAVELGVSLITPLFTERGGVKLSAERVENRLTHWRKVVSSACEQSGRSHMPMVATPMRLDSWLNARTEGLRLLLHPGAGQSLKQFQPGDNSICLAVGPWEGGFSADEVALVQRANFQLLRLALRILRTETAAPVAIAAMQCLWGDMG